MHCFKWITGIFLLFILTEFNAISQEKTLITKVVIDAGHGGKDPGALGKKTQEKNITLQIALKLGTLISQGCKDVHVTYTRDKDEFIELHERAGVANRQKADLFISIHCNSNPSHSFRGAETYVMGLHKSAANLAIAKQENASILMEPDYATTYNGFDPNSDESYITFSLYQDAYLGQSTDFARNVQEEMKSRVGLNDRGVRQAGFLVLYKTTMPSVLVETGFLSNAEEEKFLTSQEGQDYIATAIFKAFKKFNAKMEGMNEGTKKESVKPGVIAIQPGKENVKPEAKVIQPNKENVKPEAKVIQPKKENVKPAQKPVEQKPVGDNLVFRVQVALSPKDIGITSPRLDGLKDVKMYRHQGMYKYTTGDENSLDEALKLQAEVQKKGFKDAFVVAFKGEERISIAEAKELMKKK